MDADSTARLARAVERWRHRDDLAGLSWSDPTNWHLTFAFLGDIDPATVARVTEGLAAVAEAHRPTRVRTHGVGAFPSPARARVAWYGVADPEHRLRRLADDVGRAVDLAPDRPFNAHVTLARARGAALDLRHWVRDAAAPNGWLDIDRLELVRSRPSGRPVHYQTLATLPLGPRA